MSEIHHHQMGRSVVRDPEIESSQDLFVPEENHYNNHQHGIVADGDSILRRQNRALSYTTITSTTTSYISSTTTIKKSYSLAVSGAAANGGGNLLCLPSGYTVCA